MELTTSIYIFTSFNRETDIKTKRDTDDEEKSENNNSGRRRCICRVVYYPLLQTVCLEIDSLICYCVTLPESIALSSLSVGAPNVKDKAHSFYH